MRAGMLILFDIDGTLLRTNGAGLRAMREAGRELFGSTFRDDGIETAGRLDGLIWSDLARLNDIEDSPEHHERFRRRYGELLAHRLQTDGPAQLLPGVREIVLALLDCGSRLSIGLLTGNYPETGRLKIRSAGLDPDLFQCSAWGCDGASRRALPPVAMRRHEERIGRMIEPSQLVIIGDTPHDIDCAKSHGCRSLAVATGAFTLDELITHEPDLAVHDLADRDSILAWLVQSPAVNTA